MKKIKRKMNRAEAGFRAWQAFENKAAEMMNTGENVWQWGMIAMLHKMRDLGGLLAVRVLENGAMINGKKIEKLQGIAIAFPVQHEGDEGFGCTVLVHEQPDENCSPPIWGFRIAIHSTDTGDEARLRAFYHDQAANDRLFRTVEERTTAVLASVGAKHLEDTDEQYPIAIEILKTVPVFKHIDKDAAVGIDPVNQPAKTVN